jgi:hypothetical protein
MYVHLLDQTQLSLKTSDILPVKTYTKSNHAPDSKFKQIKSVKQVNASKRKSRDSESLDEELASRS